MALDDIANTDLVGWLQNEDRRSACESNLLEFTKEGWQWVEPGPLHINRHIECLCEHFEAVAHQQVLRLLINIPPRHMKSLEGNVFFPAWVWANRPRKINGAQTNKEGWFGP